VEAGAATVVDTESAAEVVRQARSAQEVGVRARATAVAVAMWAVPGETAAPTEADWVAAAGVGLEQDAHKCTRPSSRAPSQS